MRIQIDTEKQRVMVLQGDSWDTMPLYSKRAFEMLSDIWLKVGWNEKYPYCFSWLGLPILQIPEDMVRMQEVIYRLKPDVIVETGVAHGGSLVFYASLCKIMDHGRVIGVEKGLRCREAIDAHPLGGYIDTIEGDSTEKSVVNLVHDLTAGEKALVILDSNHSKEHVARELEAYHDMVAPGFYIVAADGNMCDLADVPRGSPEWKWNNPQEAALEFANAHPQFVIEQPAWPFNESGLNRNITYLKSAWLRRTA